MSFFFGLLSYFHVRTLSCTLFFGRAPATLNEPIIIKHNEYIVRRQTVFLRVGDTEVVNVNRSYWEMIIMLRPAQQLISVPTTIYVSAYRLVYST